jgi:hypothetical protein
MLPSTGLRLASYYAYATALRAQWYILSIFWPLFAADPSWSFVVFLVSAHASRCEASHLWERVAWFRRLVAHRSCI